MKGTRYSRLQKGVSPIIVKQKERACRLAERKRSECSMGNGKELGTQLLKGNWSECTSEMKGTRYSGLRKGASALGKGKVWEGGPKCSLPPACRLNYS